MESPKINNLDDLTELLANQEKRIHDLEQANAELVSEVKKRFVSKAELPVTISNVIPKSGLFSPSFLQRAFSVWGYHFVAQLLINIVLSIIYLIIFVVILKHALIPWFLKM
jgi:hypothetical protein